MKDICETPDFLYPLKADIFYPIVEQGAYGNIQKQWVLDRTITCNFEPAGTASAEEVKPNVKINMDVVLLGRTKKDVRIMLSESKQSITNVIITNIRTHSNVPVYLETSGPRSGKSTICSLLNLFATRCTYASTSSSFMFPTNTLNILLSGARDVR